MTKPPEEFAYYAAVSRIESGKYEGMALKTLEKIAKATGTWLKVDFVSA